MKRLRKRPRADLLAQRPQAKPFYWGRRVYLALLVLAFGSLANYFVGPAITLRADGIVVRDRYEVSASFPARVRSVLVKSGEQVNNGQVLAELDSASTLRDLADLSVRNAELAARSAQLRARLASIDALMPLAARHASEAQSVMARFDKMPNRSLITSARLDEALSSRFLASSRLVELQAETRVLGAELLGVAGAYERASLALEELSKLYDQGRIRAPHSGLVGATVASPGHVLSFGDKLLDVHVGDSYVLAYLPDFYLFEIKSGDPVTVSVGAQSVSARIDEILAVADALPPEFQNQFRPRDRSRLMRIRLDSEIDFAVSQKVAISGCFLGLCDPVAAIFGVKS